MEFDDNPARETVEQVILMLLIPAAVAVAWLVGYPLAEYRKMYSIIDWIDFVGDSRSHGVKTLSDVAPTPSLRRLDTWLLCSPGKQSVFSLPLHDEANCLILHGDEERSSEAERQKAIWESDTANLMYYGNYITALIVEMKSSKDTNGTELFEKELRYGERLDSDNARYNYLLASLMLEQACDIKNIDKGWCELVIKDRGLLDKAMAEFLKGQSKPVWKTYAFEMMRLRFSLMRMSRNLSEKGEKIGWLADLQLPDLGKMRQLSKASVLYGQQLLAENRKAEAIPFLEACEPLFVKIINDSFTLVEQMTGASMMDICKAHAIPLMEGAGENERAREMKIRADLLLQPIVEYYARWKLTKNSNEPLRLLQRGGVLTCVFAPVYLSGLPTNEDLAFERWTEYVIMERICMIGFLRLFLLLMPAMLLITLRWRISGKFSTSPILILPRGIIVVRILLFSVVIPLSLYILYTRFSGLSSHEYSISYSYLWFAIELTVLAWVITFLSALLLVLHIYHRCRSLGIQVPARVSVLKLAIITLIPFGLLVWLSRGKKEGLFRGTVARSMIPVFAGVVILIGTTTGPYFPWSERRLVENDPVTSPVERGEGFTRMEVLEVQRLKKRFLNAMKTIEKYPSDAAKEKSAK